MKGQAALCSRAASRHFGVMQEVASAVEATSWTDMVMKGRAALCSRAASRRSKVAIKWHQLHLGGREALCSWVESLQEADSVARSSCRRRFPEQCQAPTQVVRRQNGGGPSCPAPGAFAPLASGPPLVCACVLVAMKLPLRKTGLHC